MIQTTPSHADGQNWANYYQAVEGRPPRETLLKALEIFDATGAIERPKFAVDLGCGEGRDTVELLRRGWRVLAVDGEQKAFDRLFDRPIDRDLLETQLMRFENLSLPPAIDLINASFCLPFCPPADFPNLWETIVKSLNPGGIFCGHLFGDRDSWTVYPDRSHHTRAQVEKLLEPFTIELLNEEEHPGVTAIGEEKYWHIFHIVARKKC
ncbi:MAG: class I SAM-dependent methyltransferase [Richelia sp. CSU_2_1]|nr:class I SAM-dependent methyltransferase [Microcoleus sp. SU_5_6]NJR24697.1 class I SAM-dependent methyltransferase [Richelia sp. CSU_2_1]